MAMSRPAKSALRSVHRRIAMDLQLTEDFYGGLVEKKIFPRDIIDVIKAEDNNQKQVYKLLELLEKRGQRAFDNFISLLRENYDWLADALLEEHEQKQIEHQIIERSSREWIPKEYPSTRSMCVCKREVLSMSETNLFQTLHTATETDCKLHCTLYTQDQPPTQHSSNKRDACVSPIQVIDSPRKRLSGTSTEKTRDIQDWIYHHNTGQKGTNTEEVNHTDVLDARNTHTENVALNDSSRQLDNKVLHPTYDDDDDEDDDFPSSEVFYEEARKSALEQHNGEDLESDIHGNNNEDDDRLISRSIANFDPVSLHMENLYYTLLCLVQGYEKQTTAASQTGNREDKDELEVTWELIDKIVGKLQMKMTQSDDTKMIQKCYELFPPNAQETPLNKCIEEALKEKTTLQDRFDKEIDKMAEKAYTHEQNKIDLTRQKRINKQLLHEIDQLKKSEKEMHSLIEEYKMKDEQYETSESTIAMLHEEIKKLKDTIKEIQEKKNPPRRMAPNRNRSVLVRQTNYRTGRNPYGDSFLPNPTTNKLQGSKIPPRK